MPSKITSLYFQLFTRVSTSTCERLLRINFEWQFFKAELRLQIGTEAVEFQQAWAKYFALIGAFAA